MVAAVEVISLAKVLDVYEMLAFFWISSLTSVVSGSRSSSSSSETGRYMYVISPRFQVFFVSQTFSAILLCTLWAVTVSTV